MARQKVGVSPLLCISTSEQVLHRPLAGQNHFFTVKTSFFVFSVTNGKKEEKFQKGKKKQDEMKNNLSLLHDLTNDY